MNMKPISVFAPATIANFIVGFDTLGACVETVDGELLGDIVQIETAQTAAFSISGPYASQLPQQMDDNIVMHTLNAFHEHVLKKGGLIQTMALRLKKCLPIGSGLGSSAASIVATLVALNHFYQSPFTQSELLAIAGRMEGVVSGSPHYDNVGPCLMGGLQLILGERSEKLPWFNDWQLVLCYPGISVSTRQAREVLPKSIALQQGIGYSQKLAAFIHALYENNRALAISLLEDPLIEPYRAKLIPQYGALRKAATSNGALAFGISGSGPTCFALTDSKTQAEQISQAMQQVVAMNAMAFCQIGKISMQGAHIIDSI